jgi:general secretion pathway protein I
MSRRRNAAQRGFTLIEVLVALSIIAYALIGLLGLQNRNLAMIARDQDMTRATLLARKFIAEMEVREKFPELGFSSGELEEGFTFEREVNETPLPDVREVRVRIIFDERQPDAVELLYYMRNRYVPEDL